MNELLAILKRHQVFAYAVNDKVLKVQHVYLKDGIRHEKFVEIKTTKKDVYAFLGY